MELLGAGRSASQVRARLGQAGRPRVEALLTTASLGASGRTYWDGGMPDLEEVPYEKCARLVPRTPDGSRVAIMEQVEVRLDPSSEGIATGQPGGRGELSGWLALPGGEAFDAASLLFAIDAFPPATFDLEFSGWVPTLELTAYIRALPAPGPVRVLQRARMIARQRVDEACFIWDRSGQLVAQGTQLARPSPAMPRARRHRSPPPAGAAPPQSRASGPGRPARSWAGLSGVRAR